MLNAFQVLENLLPVFPREVGQVHLFCYLDPDGDVHQQNRQLFVILVLEALPHDHV